MLIDGHDVRDLSSSRCARRSASCSRSRCCSPASIGDNIRYGRLDATDEEVVAAAQAANAHDFVSALPNGYDTELGERGAQLSGGERQRISVARAFLKDAPILILDEPTSSIDSQTEAVILDALERLIGGPHDVHGRAPAVDDPRRGPDPRHQPRARRRAGHATTSCSRVRACTGSCGTRSRGRAGARPPRSRPTSSPR